MKGVRRSPCLSAVMLSACALVGSALPAGAQSLVLSTASGGVTISGTNPTWRAGFGNVNGMGIGTPGTGVTVLTTGVTGGVLYRTTVNLVISGVTGTSNQGEVRAYMSTNFSHPTILQARVCYPAASCTAAASYTAISLVSGSPTQVIPASSGNGTYAASIGLFVSSTNGASAFAGADTATINLDTYRSSNNTLRQTDTLALNNPSETVQTALRLLLATAGGITITPASDFSTSFGTVNGLGIAPGAGLTASAVTGGMLYATPYAIQPTFAGFTSTTGTVKVYVSTDFAHPTILELRDSPDNITYTAISKLVGTQTSISSTLTSASSLTRYLGLFVSSLNGVGAFTGADAAVLKFTLIVP